MSQRLTVELSDELFSVIERQAVEANISPAQVASASLERYFHDQQGAKPKVRSRRRRNDADPQAARERFEKHFGAIDLGYATGLNNEEIDADLEREYADAHEKEY